MDPQTNDKQSGNQNKVEAAVTAALFLYDPAKRAYKSLSTGRYLTAQEVRKVVDAVIDSYQAEFVAISARLQAGELSLAEWQMQMAQAVKGLHVATAVAANGGFNNMSQADYGFVGSQVKRQYQFLQGFADDIVSGKQLVQSGSLLNRTKLYAQAARGTYEQTARRRERLAGSTEEKRNLGASDSCQTCLDEAAKSWQPIGTLRAIGDSLCLANCRCEFSYK
ncbi:MAG: hypothetical protein J0I20_35795 [Chloroflexi bacterium]|nr:hypothetical protein [Chloroflexota bacterium]OJV86969.1 MAG: hypothetical protein BGO39_28615 [Chloroflexi bacterium 54-19]